MECQILFFLTYFIVHFALIPFFLTQLKILLNKNFPGLNIFITGGTIR